MPRSSTISVISLVLLASQLPVRSVLASDDPTNSLALEQDTRTLVFGLETSASVGVANSSGGSVNAMILSLAPSLYLSRKIAVGIGIRQALSISGFNTLFFSPDLEATYALTGGLITRKDTVRLGDTEVMQGRNFYPGGWRAKAFLNTLFYNGSQIASFTGAGIGIVYAFRSEKSSHLNAMARADFVANSSISVSIFSLGVSYTFDY